MRGAPRHDTALAFQGVEKLTAIFVLTGTGLLIWSLA